MQSAWVQVDPSIAENYPRVPSEDQMGSAGQIQVLRREDLERT